MCYRKSPCPSLRLATTPCNSCTKANIPMPISQVPTSTAESTASYGKLRCDKHNRDGDIMFTSWDMYGYVILRYNGDTMRIYTVDICWLWLWSALARYGMYVYIYIQYSQRVDQNSNSQYGKLWLTIKFGGALLLVCLENGEWTPQLRVFFHREYGVSELGFNPFNKLIKKVTWDHHPIFDGMNKSYHQPEWVWPCIAELHSQKPLRPKGTGLCLTLSATTVLQSFQLLGCMGHGNGPMAARFSEAKRLLPQLRSHLFVTTCSRVAPIDARKMPMVTAQTQASCSWVIWWCWHKKKLVYANAAINILPN